MDESITIENAQIILHKKNDSIYSICISSSIENNVIIDHLNQELTTLFSMKEVCMFHTQTSNIVSNLHTLEQVKNKYENELLLLRQDLQEKQKLFEKNKQLHEEEMNVIKIKFSQFIVNLNSSIEMRVSQETRHLEEKFKIKEDFYKHTIQELKETQIALNTIHNDNTTIMNILQKPKSSAKIGIEGEQSIYNILRSFTQYNMHAKVENVSSSSMTGDIRFVYDRMSCCIEVKNIKEDIGQSHFDKFYRDLHKPSNQYNCGIFISIQSGFTIKSQIEDMEIRIYDNRPIIYLAHTQQNQDKIILSIHMINRLVKLIQSGYTLETHQYIEQFKKQIDQLTAIQNQLKNMKQSIKLVEDITTQSKKNIYEMLTKEDISINEKPQSLQITTPCGKIYKGVTKNYKNHLSTCLCCKRHIEVSSTL